MTEMRNYSGNPIDAAWNKAPWNDKDGETVEKGTTTHNGHIDMTELPNEVDEDDLTELQETIIRTAVRNPELSTAQVDEIAGCADGYSCTVLPENVPRWYENTFKKAGKSLDHSRDDLRDDGDDGTVETSAEPETDEHTSESLPSGARAQPQSEPNAEQPPGWQTYAVVGLVAFILGLLWGGRND